MTEFAARNPETQEFFSTKKAFKEAVEKENVILSNFNVDDIFNAYVTMRNHKEIRNYLENGKTIQVTGPDPRNNRKWYADIELDSKKAIGFKVL